MIPLLHNGVTRDHLREAANSLDPNHVGPDGPRSRLLLEWLAGEVFGVSADNIVLTSSGTAAIELALRVSRAERATLPAYGFRATMDAARAALGDNVEFVDVWHPALKDSGECGRRDAARVFVSLLGEVEPVILERMSKSHSGPIILDAACSVGSHGLGEVCRNGVVDAACVSFAASKIISAGGGGAVAFSSLRNAKRATEILRWDMCNARMSELNASLAVVMTEKFDQRIANCMSWARRVSEKLIFDAAHSESCAHHVVALSDERNHLARKLECAGIETSGFPKYRALASDFPVAERWASRAIYLPHGPGLSISDQDKILEVLCSPL